MMGKSFLEHILNDRNDRAFERHPRQLSGTACALHKIVAHAECNGAQCSIAVGKRYGSALDQIAEAGFRHGLQQRVFVPHSAGKRWPGSTWLRQRSPAQRRLRTPFSSMTWLVRPSACGGCVECADPSSLTFFCQRRELTRTRGTAKYL
jgi:hypothetical protein